MKYSRIKLTLQSCKSDSTVTYFLEHVDCLWVLLLFLFLDVMYAEITKSIEHSVEAGIFQANTPLGIITEKAVAMKARSAKRTTVKKLVNQLSITQTTKTSSELNNTENTRKKRATTVNGLSMKNTPEMIQEEKVKTDYDQNNCSPKFFFMSKTERPETCDLRDLLIVIYGRSHEQYRQYRQYVR